MRVTTPTARLAALFLVLLATSGCAIGFNAGTTQVRGSGNAVEATLDNGVGIRNAVIVHNASASTVVVTLTNSSERADQLLAVEVSGEGSEGLGTPTLQPQVITVPARGAVAVGLTADQPRITMTGAPARPSQFVEVTFVFRDAGRLTVNLLGVEQRLAYADIPVG